MRELCLKPCYCRRCTYLNELASEPKAKRTAERKPSPQKEPRVKADRPAKAPTKPREPRKPKVPGPGRKTNTYVSEDVTAAIINAREVLGIPWHKVETCYGVPINICRRILRDHEAKIPIHWCDHHQRRETHNGEPFFGKDK